MTVPKKSLEKEDKIILFGLFLQIKENFLSIKIYTYCNFIEKDLITEDRALIPNIIKSKTLRYIKEQFPEQKDLKYTANDFKLFKRTELDIKSSLTYEDYNRQIMLDLEETMLNVNKLIINPIYKYKLSNDIILITSKLIHQNAKLEINVKLGIATPF